jgi:hypothetical protein
MGVFMRKFLIGVFSLMVCFLLIGCATQDIKQSINTDDFGIHFVEKNGGFSMYAPKDWETVDAGQRYMMLMGARENNFSPNISFTDEQFTGKVSEYADVCLELFPQILADFELLERTDFITNDGIQGECITTRGRLNEIQVRQRLYLIPNKRNTVIIGIICTVSPIMGTKYDNIFDTCVKTFEWE